MGPDGALWFAELGSNKIGRITTAGVVTEYAAPSGTAHDIGRVHPVAKRHAIGLVELG